MAFRVQMGHRIPGLTIHGQPANYPVVNEREVRAAAGIMLVLGAFAFANAALQKQFIYLQSFVVLFFIEFAIRIFINPDYAPIYALAKRLVSNQTPEYAGAIQKIFAWTLGFILASTMIIVAVILQIRGTLPFSICSLCLFFLWAESALGICIGCKIYGLMFDRGLVNPKVRPACAGGVCSVKR